MTRRHPPQYPLRPYPERPRIEWGEVLTRMVGIVVLGAAALLLVALW